METILEVRKCCSDFNYMHFVLKKTLQLPIVLALEINVGLKYK